jgi:hypothetical protein
MKHGTTHETGTSPMALVRTEDTKTARQPGQKEQTKIDELKIK